MIFTGGPIMWEKELEIANLAAEAAGGVLVEKYGHLSKIKKKGEIDLVTEADIEAEKAIMEIIVKNFPGDTLIAEESGPKKEGSDRIWIIDPLDGTTNFAHEFPFFAVSLALQVKGDIILGIVHSPCMKEYFEAVRGSGAFLNKKPIRVSRTKDVSESLLATGFPYDIHDNPYETMELFSRMLVKAQGLRRPGSAAMDLCYVAAGRFDGFWEQGLKPWDTAAGILIVEESGGRVTTFDGSRFSPFSDTIIASNGPIHDELMGIINAG
jgi:myo-inositol-1(or 4)-monophosphatase